MIRLKSIAPEPLKAVAGWAADRLPLARKPAILMYHRIGDEAFDPWGLSVEESLFEEQLAWLARNRAVVPLSEFAGRHREGRLRNDSVAITFDDGYAATAKTAVRLLTKFGMPATVFLPVELIERGRGFWWDELARIAIGYRGESLCFEGARIAVPQPQPRDSLWRPGASPATPRQKLFHSMRSRLRARAPSEVEAAVAELRGQAQNEASEADRPLTTDEVRAIPSQTIEFGSHALTHPSLPALGEAEMIREIRESRARCASLTGTAPAAFAYPFGEYDRSVMRLVEEAGFACAVTSDRGFVGRRSKLFALPRIRIGNRRFR